MSSLSSRSVAGDLDAVDARQAEVEHDQVGHEGLGLVQRLGPVVGDLDVVALHAQRALQDLGDLLIVLDDEHAYGAVGCLHRTDTRRVLAAQRQLLPRPEEAGSGRRASKGVRPRCRPPAVAPSPSAKPRSKPRARRSPPQWRASLPKLEQRHFDVIGLGLVATAVFFAFVIYLGWDGGQAGDGAVEGLRVADRRRPLHRPGGADGGRRDPRAAARAPGRAPVQGRRDLPVRRAAASASPPARSASARAAAPISWEPEWVKPRGGVVGEGLYWATSTALGDLGAHTIAIFLFTAAVLLLTGASVAGVVKATSDSISTTTREVRTAVQRRRPATEELTALELGPPPRASAIARTLPGARRDAARRARRRRGPRADRRVVGARRSCPRPTRSRTSPRTPRPTSPASHAPRRPPSSSRRRAATAPR